MSESMLHIQSAHIEGYKSLYNSDVAFKPGLNIIIGKNGSGKSNLINALDSILLLKRGVLGIQHFEVMVSAWEGVEVTFDPADDKRDRVEVSGRKVICFRNADQEPRYSMHTDIPSAKWLPLLVNIPFQLSLGIHFLDHPVSTKLAFVGGAFSKSSLYESFSESDQPYFVRYLFWDLLLKLEHTVSLDFESLPRLFKEIMCLDELNSRLRNFSPVEEVRLSQTFAVQVINSDSCNVLNAAYEFRVGDDWYLWGDLSDGTRRILYVLFASLLPAIWVQSKPALPDQERVPRIIFLEEPELGIHPHQLHQLLLFLKEQSQMHQVILTTHSPQVLDILDKDELDRIIIATYDSREGSKFHHLDEGQKAKALAYMEDMLLSDYWRFSDLEPRVVV